MQRRHQEAGAAKKRSNIRRGGLTILLAALLYATPARAHEPAQQQPTPAELPPPRGQTWVGAHTMGGDWSIYSGATYALTGAIGHDGWRMRVVGGHGRYSYSGTPDVNGVPSPTTFDGHTGFTDLMVGYRMQSGNLIFKAFLGGSTATHSVLPFDPANIAIGTTYGIGGALEAWLNVTHNMWFSGEATYTTAFQTFDTTLRAGYRIWPQLSLGVEAGALGNEDFQVGRLAAFGAYEFGIFRGSDSYLRLSAGTSGDRDTDLKPYASVSLAVKY